MSKIKKTTKAKSARGKGASGKRASGKFASAAPKAPARVARVAKGKKPQYFSDPAIDKLLWMTLTMMEELSVTRDRLDAIERLLDRKRVLKRADIDAFKPRDAEAAERAARRSAYVDRMMRAVHAELEEIAGRGLPASEDDAVSAVES